MAKKRRVFSPILNVTQNPLKMIYKANIRAVFWVFCIPDYSASSKGLSPEAIYRSNRVFHLSLFGNHGDDGNVDTVTRKNL